MRSIMTLCNNVYSSHIGCVQQPVGACPKFIEQIQQVCAFWGVRFNKQFLFSCLFQIKFEHFSSSFTDAVRRNQNASKRTGHGGCLHGPSCHGSKTQHSSHGLRRRRRKTSATANLQQPRFVTPKVRKKTPVRSGSDKGRVGELGDAKRRCCITLSPQLLMRERGRVMNSYLKLQFSGFECSHVVETHFLPFSSRFPCQVWHTKCLLLLSGTWKHHTHTHMHAHTQMLWGGG